MCLRAAVVYVFALLIVKAGKQRFMGKNSALDVVMVIVLGSVVSRAINGSAPFIPTLAAGLVLVLLHRLTSWMAARSKHIADFVEGKHVVLVTNGMINWTQMRKHDITENDLYSALRLQANTENLTDVKHIYLEPNGKFSIVKK
jgi:uncharacterized membrane protein YcaP (DUF421 family)